MANGRSRVLLLSLVAFLSLLLQGATSASAPLVVHFIDVGQGDCCWLCLPDGDDVLVDAGKPQNQAAVFTAYLPLVLRGCGS